MELLEKANLHFLLIGEVHGTKETPAIFSDLICRAAGSGRKTVVGLEFSTKDQTALDEFMRASSPNRAEQVLLTSNNWKSFDGRSSVAMLALLQRLKGMKRRGEIQDVIFFGDSTEERMASALLNAGNRYPTSLIVALTGNVHASKRMVPMLGSYPLMAMLLPADQTVSLFVADRGGMAWNRIGDECGPHSIASTDGKQRSVVLAANAGVQGAYDGRLSTSKRAAASPPVLPHTGPQCSVP